MSIANELITRGWVQRGGEGMSRGPVCLMGAVEAAGIPEHVGWQAIQRVIGSVGGVRCWNDKPGRTFDEVLRVAKEADEILGAS